MKEKFKKMTHKSIRVFINEMFSKPPRKIYATNKTVVHHIDDIWSLDILELKDYGEQNIRWYRYVLVVIDKLLGQFLSKMKMLKQQKTLSKTLS